MTSSPSKNWFGRMRARAAAHKIWTTIIVIVLAFVGYKIYSAYAAGNVTPTYTLAAARMGSITQTVTGSGQVSAENQLDVTSQVSGAVQAVNVKVGDHVTKGQLLATIDAHDAYVSLQNAQIAYAKLTAPAKAGDLTNAENSVIKSYSDGFNSVADAFVNLSSVMSGMKSLLYDQGGFLSEVYSTHLNSTAHPMRDAAGIRFDAAAQQYTRVLQEYQGLSRTSPKASIDTLIADTYAMLKSVSTAVQQTQGVVTYVSVNQPEYYSRDAVTAVSNTNTWSNIVNSALSSVLAAQSGVTSSANSLTTLTTGADNLDVQSQQLSLQQAQEAYAKYFVRAPFDGIVGRIPVSVYAQAGASTVVATIVGDQKIATISLNEVDAAKVAVDQPVAITFDAIDGFTATGTVSQVDLVGTVSSGVVSYSVKILINTADARIKPGMSLNTTITTKQKNDVLVVPSAAVKSLGGASYVQTLDKSLLGTTRAATGNNAARFASSTNMRRISTTTMTMPTSSAGTGTFSTFAGSISMSVSTAVVPTRVNVTVGDTDDTYTEITSGLSAGDLVVTKTAAGTTASAAAPSILSGIGGNRGAAAGATRTTGAAAGNVRTVNFSR